MASRVDYEVVADKLFKAKPSKDEYQYATKYTQWQIDCQVVGMAFGSLSDSFDFDRFINRCKHGTERLSRIYREG